MNKHDKALSYITIKTRSSKAAFAGVRKVKNLCTIGFWEVAGFFLLGTITRAETRMMGVHVYSFMDRFNMFIIRPLCTRTARDRLKDLSTFCTFLPNVTRS